MILTVNIGNTHITIAGYEHDTLQFSGRLHSSPAATGDEYAMNLLNPYIWLPPSGSRAAFWAVWCPH